MQLIGLQKETKMGVLFISHDLSLVATIADAYCSYASRGNCRTRTNSSTFQRAKTPYTKRLLRPPKEERLKVLPSLNHFIDGGFIPTAETEKERSQRHDLLYQQPQFYMQKDCKRCIPTNKSSGIKERKLKH